MKLFPNDTSLKLLWKPPLSKSNKVTIGNIHINIMGLNYDHLFAYHNPARYI